MPKREDLQKILILGSGPIVIGQAAEFDYSGTQACKALRNHGYEVILVNSNPATIMTDPEVADRTYIEPLTEEFVERVIALERPDALLPTLGGQTALNLASLLYERGILEKYGVELIGANYDAIQKGEDRKLFQEAMNRIGIATPAGKMVHSLEEAREFQKTIGFPAILRPSFTLGGTGGGIAHDQEEFDHIMTQGLHDSPVGSVLVEQSVLGWKEYELEVMRDSNDTVVIICAIENVDPMGVHTGDSITVAPAQTLSDEEYQKLRDAAIKIIREIGVETGGSNVQFAINPENGDMIVIEMNPRVSRSSALASKATGYPIAKIAALLAVGYHLDELPNDITRETRAAFEPALDYVVTKVPRFAFEKFPGALDRLGTQMRSVGEVMAIGRTFKESLQKALRSLEADTRQEMAKKSVEQLEAMLYPNPERIHAVIELMRRGFTVQNLHGRTAIDTWFLTQLFEIVQAEREIVALGDPHAWKWEAWREIKRLGFSDRQLAELTDVPAETIHDLRVERHAAPVFKRVDTCAAEFEAYTPYLYSTYEWEDEAPPNDVPKVMILGSGPNRIGQGVEFDYATVHAVWALRDAGFEAIMVNSNPETVSTDYDTADRLYFEPLTLEDVSNIAEHERPDGIIVQLGGQTPLKLARGLEQAGLPIWGTSPTAIHLAEDRFEFQRMCEKLNIPQPQGAVANTPKEAEEHAEAIGYPVMVRPSYVLGGRAMQTVHSREELLSYLREVYSALPDTPSVLVDKFIEGAKEVDVDALCDGTTAVIGGIMEHIELAGVHSGDSACITPPVSLSQNVIDTITKYTKALALEIGVVGLMNVQYLITEADEVYIVEANPRASRTIPYLSKAIGHPLAKYAALLKAGKTLEELNFTETPRPDVYSVKEAVFPFLKFEQFTPLLGPEMRSTGESMGIAKDPYLAYYKAALAAGAAFPARGGTVCIRGDDVAHLTPQFSEAGYEIVDDPLAAQLYIDTTKSGWLRKTLENGSAIVTTREGAEWTLQGLRSRDQSELSVLALQDL